MNYYSSLFILSSIFSSPFLLTLCFADCDHLQDTCPTSTPIEKQTIFINGFPCKNPSNISSSDFKSTILKQEGKTDNFFGSSVNVVTAAEYPGLNTLGLSISRTDLAQDGIVMPHSHPRASEIFFVNKGIVLAGFIDTKNKIFQKALKEGDVIVFPRGLLHFCLNTGFESATAFSVHNSQNPGVVSVSTSIFAYNEGEIMDTMMKKLVSFSTQYRLGNVSVPLGI